MALARARAVQDLMKVFANSTGCMAHGSCRRTDSSTSDVQTTDYAYEITSATYRFGKGVTKELPYDLEFYKSTKPLVVTDPMLSNMQPVKTVLDVLTKHKVKFDVYDRVRVEPSEKSMMDIISVARSGYYDSFIAVGGGSVMDSTKMASIYAANSDVDFWDYVQKPYGKDMNPISSMLPVICLPTTAGTGSESTGISIFEIEGKHVKNGVRKRELVPHLALVDVDHVMLMPRNVAVYSGFDVLCHALESFTIIPFHARTPRPARPLDRPLSQGGNPVSDIWSRAALKILKESFLKSIQDPGDEEARSNILFASSLAGMGFGNAGVHLCHGLSYPLSGHVRQHSDEGYPTEHPLLPHGLSVCLTAPADFEFTGAASPDRHLEAAGLLGCDIRNAKQADAGKILADKVREFMSELKVPNGLKETGYEWGDIPRIAEGAMSSLSARKLCPRPQTIDDIVGLYERSWTVY